MSNGGEEGHLRILVCTEAGLEDSVDVRGGGVVLASDTIEEMLAESGGVGASGVAGLEAEDTGTHEVVPFDSLDVGVGVTLGGREGVGEDETTDGVTTVVGAVGVHLSSTIIRVHVDLDLVDEAGDLDVSGGLHELDTSQGAGGDDTGSVSGEGAPCHGLAFGVTDVGVGYGRAPEAEIGSGVEDRGLALRGRSFGRGVANVV